MTRLEALIAMKASVEAGTFGSREWDLCDLAFGQKGLGSFAFQAATMPSVDVVLSLHEVVLPEWDFALMTRRKHKDTAATVSPPFFQGSYEWHCNKDPARAWLLAILSALIAMETDRE